MAKQTFTTGQVLTAAQMTSLQQTAMLGGAASAKTASYTLVAADAGTAISMSNAGATTITVNTGLFAAGDTVQITNLGAGVCTITAGTATVNSSASLALAQYESGTLDFTSTSAAIFIKGAGAAAGGSSFVGANVYKSSATTIGNATWTNVPYEAENFDTTSFHDNSTNNTRMTIPTGKDGKYLVTANLSFDSNASGIRASMIRKNGADYTKGVWIGAFSESASLVASATLDLVAGDYVEMQVFQNSGGNLNLQGNSQANQFSIVYLGA